METQPEQEKHRKTRRAGAGRTKNPNAVAGLSKPSVSVCDDIHVLIAQRAFERFQARGSQDGFDLDNWLEAEREILNQIPPGS